MEDVKNGNFTPTVVYDGREPLEFSALPLTLYQDKRVETFESISAVLENYYAMKNTITRIRQRSSDLRRIVNTALERNRKKYELQLRQLKDTEKREKFRVYGELINTYGYNLEPGAKKLEALNYYINEMVTIPLDDTLTPQENAQKNFEKYNKMKRTFEALSTLTKRDEGGDRSSGIYQYLSGYCTLGGRSRGD